MISRFVLGAFLVVLMAIVGPSTYVYLGSRASKVAFTPQKPTVATSPTQQGFSLPGTLYVTQAGALYSLSAGRFHQLTAEEGWTQPSMTPDGNLLMVKQTPMYSDVYVVSRFGTPIRRITTNAAPPRQFITSNHWSFYPRASADGNTLFMAYDQPKAGYDVVFSIWAMPMGGNIRQGKLWTNAADYTGGDVQPVPVPGGVIYTKYDYASRYDPNQPTKLVAMLWLTSRAYSPGKELTLPGEDCRNPSLSPDGKQVAMICTYQKQVSYLTIASWDGSKLGPRRNMVVNQLVAMPAWAPDGSGIAYLAPSTGSGPFQLWFLPRAAYAPLPTPAPTPTPGGPHNGPLPTPSPVPAVVVKPIQVTTNNGFDATSTLAWRQ